MLHTDRFCSLAADWMDYSTTQGVGVDQRKDRSLTMIVQPIRTDLHVDWTWLPRGLSGSRAPSQLAQLWRTLYRLFSFPPSLATIPTCVWYRSQFVDQIVVAVICWLAYGAIRKIFSHSFSRWVSCRRFLLSTDCESQWRSERDNWIMNNNLRCNFLLSFALYLCRSGAFLLIWLCRRAFYCYMLYNGGLEQLKVPINYIYTLIIIATR